MRTVSDGAQVLNTLRGTWIEHRAIASTFSDKRIERVQTSRLNFRKTEWDAVRKHLEKYSGRSPIIETATELEHQTEALIRSVQRATTIHAQKCGRRRT
jgi:hypothetical protein